MKLSAKELYFNLGLCKSQWSRWYKSNIVNNSQFKENKDWIKTKVDVMSKNGGHVGDDFDITSTFALHIINSAKTIKSDVKINLLKKYSLIDKIEVISKPEIEYLDLLEKFLSKWKVNIETQVLVCNNKYRVDFIVDGSIIIEFDEEHHNYQIYEDRERMDEINTWYKLKTNGCSELYWIRVKKGEEVQSLSEITSKLIEMETLYIDDNKLKVSTYKFNELF